MEWLILIGVPLYLLPAILAYNKPQGVKVAVVNIFLGWTAIGWIAALIWAVHEPEFRLRY